MADPTLKVVFYAAMERIQQRTASDSDLALVFIGAELIDSLGDSQEMAKIVDQLEAKWKVAQGEYARGKV